MRMTTFMAGLCFLALACSPVAKAQTMDKTSLDPKQRSVVAISAFTANGDLENLRAAVVRGLDDGLAVNEIKEIMVQLYAYCGFPRSLNALTVLMETVEERRERGIVDQPGREPGPMPEGRTSLEYGTENQTRLTGRPVQGPLFEFAPAIDQFLKAHLFGDIFQRDNLDWLTREIATISALACIEGVEPQLRSHLAIGMHNGLSQDRIREIIAILGERVGPKAAENAAGAFAGMAGQ